MTITPHFTIDNKAGWRGDTTLVLDHVSAAFAVWSNILAGNADVQVKVEFASLGTSGGSKILASASIDQYSYAGVAGALRLYESPIAAELKTGTLKAATGAEVTIAIDAGSLSNGTFFIDPDPQNSTSASGIMGRQYDLLSVLIHEVGHALGMNGWRAAGGTLNGYSESTFDALVGKANGQLVFQGENAKAVAGANPILDYNSVYHFQSNDLLDPYAEPGRRDLPSRLDAAVFADLGMGTRFDDVLTTEWGRLLDLDAGNDLVRLNAFKDGMIIHGRGNSDIISENSQQLTVFNAEHLQLSDARVTLPSDGFAVRFDEQGISGYCFRLYEAALDRVPDPVGLGGWIDYLDRGGNRLFVVQGFADSAEFQAKYGSLNDLGFVQQLYHNVLGRDGETAGVNGWMDALSQGATRAHVLEGFSESDENYAVTHPAVANGILYQEWHLA